MNYTCAICATPVSDDAYCRFFNHLHETTKGLAIPTQFAESEQCAHCFALYRLALQVEGLCANFTGIHTRINKDAQEISNLKARITELENLYVGDDRDLYPRLHSPRLR